jgi:DNA-binding IclR family transcriptional regulator
VKAVPALDKAIAVLRTLGTQPEHPMTLSELSESTGTSASTCHSIVMALCEAGFLIRHQRRKTYSLGPAIMELGGLAARGYLGLTAARDQIVDLSRDLRLSTIVGARDDDELIIVAHHENGWDLGASRTGFRSPMVPPLGMLFYAWEDNEALDEWLMRCRSALNSPEVDRYRSAVTEVRERGYWVSLSGTMQALTMEVASKLADESDPDVRLQLAAELLAAFDATTGFEPTGLPTSRQDMIGGPVFGPDGRVVLTITAAGSPNDVEDAGVERVAAAVMSACEAVTTAIGGRHPAASSVTSS